MEIWNHTVTHFFFDDCFQVHRFKLMASMFVRKVDKVDVDRDKLSDLPVNFLVGDCVASQTKTLNDSLSGCFVTLLLCVAFPLGGGVSPGLLPPYPPQR